MIKVSEKLDALQKVGLNDLNDFQGNLKELREPEFIKLVGSLVKYGFCFPLYVWQEKTKIWTLDGHQRIKVLKMLQENPHYAKVNGKEIQISSEQKPDYKQITIPDQIPVIYIEAKNRNDAKEKLLIHNSQYGKITKDGFDEFIAELPEIENFISDFTTFENMLDNPFEDSEIEEKEPENKEIAFFVQIHCDNEKHQENVYKELIEKGFNCIKK